MNATDILNKAAQHMADRAATYDKPEGERSMNATVNAFYAVTGVALTEEQGWLFMALLKAVRSQQGAFRADSYEDGAAYFALAGESAHADRNPSEEWKKFRDAARAEMAGRSCKAAKIDSGPMWVERRRGSEVPPVAKDVMVEVRLRDGDTEIAPAGDFAWEHDGDDYDIVAWREPWPDDERIDAIGQNGETGENYTGKPSWNDAPGWAKWLAQSPNGGWYWFNLRPIPKADGSGWFLADSSCHLGQIRFAGTGIASPMWRYTLELRPA